jgi:hypothetical protein
MSAGETTPDSTMSSGHPPRGALSSGTVSSGTVSSGTVSSGTVAAQAAPDLGLTILAAGPVNPIVTPASGKTVWMTGTTELAAYREDALVSACQLGWLIRAPFDFMAAWNGGKGASDVIIRTPRGASGIESRLGDGIVTIDTGFVPRTPTRVDLLVTGPLNDPRDGWAPLSSVIEADWSPLSLTLHFVFTRPGQVIFKAGEPLAQIIPLARGLPERMPLRVSDGREDGKLRHQRALWRTGERFLDPAPRGYGAVRAEFEPYVPPERATATPPATQAVRGDDAIRMLSMMEIYCEESFLDDDDCTALTACFQRQQGMLMPQSGEYRFFDNRVLWHSRLIMAEPGCANLMQRARRGIKERLRKFFAIPAPIYSDSIQLVKWEGGQAMPPHADSVNPDGSPHPTAHRAFAAIVYLNDDYDGGEIWFPNQNMRVPPRRGLLVAFRGGLSHMHGVTEVTRGVRYTMPSWYGLDPAHRETTDY